MSETSRISKSRSDASTATKKMAVCAAAIALAYVTSFIRILSLPFGGGVTLFSMLFLCLIGYWYGLKYGLISGFLFGILQFLQDPIYLNPLQMCCDYLLAFTCLGLSGLFTKSKKGLVKGYILAVLARGFWHTLGGYLFWMSYMPDNFPKSLAVLYPVIYNYSYLVAETVISLIVVILPPVKKGLETVRKSVI